MSMDQIIGAVRDLDGALVVIPGPGSDAPELAWGDAFFYYAPDGVMPQHVQPYGTIVTKDYPDDTASELDAPGRWRVNVHVDRATFRRLTGEEPRNLTRTRDHAATDVFTPHPVYGASRVGRRRQPRRADHRDRAAVAARGARCRACPRRATARNGRAAVGR